MALMIQGFSKGHDTSSFYGVQLTIHAWKIFSTQNKKMSNTDLINKQGVKLNPGTHDIELLIEHLYSYSNEYTEDISETIMDIHRPVVSHFLISSISCMASKYSITASHSCKIDLIVTSIDIA